MKIKKILLLSLFVLVFIFPKNSFAAPTFNLIGSFIDGPADFMVRPRSVKIQGNYAYVLTQVDASITIFNISNPASPAKVGQIQDLANLSGKRFLEVKGNYVYVGGTATNLLVAYDISNPALPTFASNINLTNIFWDFQIKGNYLYAFGDNGTTWFTIVDM